MSKSELFELIHEIEESTTDSEQSGQQADDSPPPKLTLSFNKDIKHAEALMRLILNPNTPSNKREMALRALPKLSPSAANQAKAKFSADQKHALNHSLQAQYSQKPVIKPEERKRPLPRPTMGGGNSDRKDELGI